MRIIVRKRLVFKSVLNINWCFISSGIVFFYLPNALESIVNSNHLLLTSHCLFMSVTWNKHNIFITDLAGF